MKNLMAKAREMDAAGDTDSARRLAKIALSRRKDRPKQEVPTFDREGFEQQRLGELMGPADAALQGAAQGVSFGTADEAQGLVRGAIAAATDWDRGGSVMDEDPGFLGRARNRFNEGYAQGRDTSRMVMNAAREDHPGAALTGEVLGARQALGMPLPDPENAQSHINMQRGEYERYRQSQMFKQHVAEGVQRPAPNENLIKPHIASSI